MSVPTSNYVLESAVIDAPFSQVYHLIKLTPEGVPSFWNAIKQATPYKGALTDEVNVFVWKFVDGHELVVKQEEHSALDHYVTYSVIESKPEISYSSQVSTVRAYPVTSGAHSNKTFVTWSASFSSDASADVVEDARYKRKEALEDLAKACAA